MPDMKARRLNIAIKSLGTIAYSTALELQLELHKRVVEGKDSGYLLFCEHPTVITLGRRGGMQCIKATTAELFKRGIKVVSTDRGGLATLHTLGQAVIYPILPLAKLGEKGVGSQTFVHLIETAIINWLATRNVAAETDNKYPGVWVQNQKIAAVGLRIAKGVSYHGAAVNINPDLSLFDLIHPCGITDRSVASLEKLIGDAPTMKEVVAELGEAFIETLEAGE
ncbi:MAG: lipoyl(octanoyl) transferase LipB [Myxococcota bacterium]